MERVRRTIWLSVLALLAVLVCSAATAGNGAVRGIDEAILKRMIGQMIMVGFVGSDPDAQGYRIVREKAAAGRITGVLYLARNIRSLSAVRALNEALQQVAPEPLLVAVDQEGGRIQRFTRGVGFREAPSAASVARDMSPAQAHSLYARLGLDLAALGFNLNLGPVVDVNINPANPIIGRLERSYSADTATVTAYGRAFVEGHRAAGVLTALKHFPGHGSSHTDSHKGIADVSGTWRESELAPYRDLFRRTEVDLVMSAHVINARLNGGTSTPASLSAEVLDGLLRRALQFKGVIISDDLQMQAIAGTRGFQDTIRQAVMAGNDILVFANEKKPDPTIPDRIAALLVAEARHDLASPADRGILLPDRPTQGRVNPADATEPGIEERSDEHHIAIHIPDGPGRVWRTAGGDPGHCIASCGVAVHRPAGRARPEPGDRTIRISQYGAAGQCHRRGDETRSRMPPDLRGSLRLRRLRPPFADEHVQVFCRRGRSAIDGGFHGCDKAAGGQLSPSGQPAAARRPTISAAPPRAAATIA